MSNHQTSQTVKWAFFTAPSCSGKTTIQPTLQQQNQAALLDNDSDILAFAFDILAPGREFYRTISRLRAWQFLRQQHDFDRLYQLLHRECFFREERPERVIAVGWLYGLRERRERAVQSFTAVGNLNIEQKLFVLNLPIEESFRRFSKAIDERERGQLPHWYNATVDKKLEIVTKHQRDFFEHHLESDEDYVECRSDEELRESISDFLKS